MKINLFYFGFLKFEKHHEYSINPINTPTKGPTIAVLVACYLISVKLFTIFKVIEKEVYIT